ncbi:MAG TPA: MarR family winged helix-turn-helix transcriptional regulator [Candidatus Acidoferrum sp.]|nr:MarR family winged helix-turn-helix transcriptional regulator [Candidatus Acidoferrum sp.]
MPRDAKMDLSGTGYCASFNLRRTARAVTRAYDTALQETGMRSTQFAILVGIAKNQPASIGALAGVLVMDPTTLTRSLRLLKKEGLINISDRSTMRQRFLSLTDKGERALARSLAAWRKAQERFVSTVGTQEWNDLRNKLENLARTVITMDGPATRITSGKSTNS